MTEPLFVCEMIWIVVGSSSGASSLDEDPRVPAVCSPVIALGARRRHLHALRRLDHGAARLDRDRLRAPPARTSCTRAPSGWQASSSSPRRSPGSFTTPRPSATGSNSARGPYSAKAIELRTMSHGAGPAASRLAQSLGLAALLSESRGDGCSRRGLGQHAARLQLRWAPLAPGSSRAAAPSPGRCCSGCRFPSTLTRWPTARCPFFCPVWWPHSWYNTRYGMELLPALALGWALPPASVIAAGPRVQAAMRQSTPPRVLFRLVALNAWQVRA